MANQNDPYGSAYDDPYANTYENKIENTENFLQNAITKSVKPFFSASDIPQIAFQGAQGVVFNAPQTAIEHPRQMSPEFENPSPIGRGIQMGLSGYDPRVSENPIAERYLEPKTTGGKIAGTVANIIGGSVLPFGAAASKVPAMTKGLRTGPIKKDLEGIERLISESKNLESGISKEMDVFREYSKIAKVNRANKAKSVAYKGAKAVKSQRIARLKEANAEFGERFSKLESKMGDEDLEKVIKNAAKEIGAHEVPGTPGNVMANQALKYGPKKSEEGIIQGIPRIYNKEEVQAITKKILDNLPDNRSKAIFYKHLLDSLPENVKGLKELKAYHSPNYNIYKESKAINKEALQRVASGTIEDEVEDLSRIAERLGSSHVERAKQVASKNRLERNIEEQGLRSLKSRRTSESEKQATLGLKKSGLERKIKDVRFRQGVTGATLGTVGVGGILSKLFNLENRKP